jgi:hypothetical protein
LRELQARRHCAEPPRDAWAALLGLAGWLPNVETVDWADAGYQQRLDELGARFDVGLHEGLMLRCRVTALEAGRTLDVAVRWRLFRARFRYVVVPRADGCELVHERLYRGLVSRALATIWRPREAMEQAAVLREWCWEAGTKAAIRRYGPV